MGQKLGKAQFYVEVDPFTNLPRRSIALLWQVFNDIADGFGITKDEMQDIFCDLAIELNISQMAAKEKACALFLILDTDKNGLVDALEMFSALAAISGMRLHEIFDFALSCYDFDGIQELSVDEVTLALKSLSVGLSKLSNLNPPSEEVVEQLVTAMFDEISGKKKESAMLSLRISEIIQALLCHGDIWTWYNYYNNSKQADDVIHTLDIKASDIDYECENQIPFASVSQKLALEWNVRCKAPIVSLGTEEKKPLTEVVAAVGTEKKEPDPWVSSAILLTPLAYAHQQIPKQAPDTTLEPVWVYGYQSEKARNNVRYTSRGDIVYHIGRYSIVYNIENHEQTIFTGHSNEIQCLAMHPNGNHVATGEVGAPSGRVIVWNCCNTHTVDTVNSNQLEILFTDNKYHENGVIHVAFSADGQLLGTIGNDKHHTLAVYNWMEQQVIFTTRVHEGNCLCLAFMSDTSNTTVAVGGDSYLLFWSRVHEGFALRPGNFSMHSSRQPITCITAVPAQSKSGGGGGVVGATTISGADQMVTGTASGQLMLWVDRNCVKVIRAHEGSVSTIYGAANCILTGGKDQRIRQWTLKLEPGATFNISPFGRNPSVRSICLSTDGTTVLFGTRGADVFEISAIDGSDVRGGPIASGHCFGELKCVAVHPSKYEFATCCDDSTIRVWDLSTHTMIKMASFDASVRTICYSPMGDVIVIGLGAGVGIGSKSGAYVVLNEEDLSIVHEARDSAKPISMVKFSPEGETLAVAADDGPIYLYAVLDDYELIGRCLRHTEPVMHMDFSVDGEWLRTNSVAKDLCFFNTDDASVQSNLPAMRDVQWASHTCIYSWHVKGIHRTPYSEEIVTDALTPTVTSNYTIIGTSFGYIKLMSFPCINEDAECHRFVGHVGDVVGTKTTFDQQRMVSAGLKDRCMVLWKVVSQTEDAGAVAIDYPESDDYALEVRGGSDLEREFMNAESCTVDSILNEKTSKISASPELDTWLGSVVPPTNPIPQHTAIPDASLRLEHVYGYQCQNMRNNIRYTAGGDLVYVAATVGVIVSPKSKAQRFFQEHTEGISSFAATSDGAIVATGQLGVTPRVYVWSTATNKPLVSLCELQMNSISALAFSSARDNYALLAVVGVDDDHTISIYNWRHNYVVSKGYGGCSHIFGIAFSPNSKEVTACGVKYLNMWNVTKRSMFNKKPVLGELGKIQPFLCCEYFNDIAHVGTGDGNIYTFNGPSLKSVVKAHEGPVSAMHVSMDCTKLVTGGKDGVCRIWNTALECTKEISVESVMTSVCPRVRSVAFSFDNSKLVIGTRGAEIFEVTIRDSNAVTTKPLMSGHGIRELWGLATHPTKEEFATCGDDCTIRIWDAKNRVVTRTLRMDAPARAINYSPDGKYLAAGFGSTKLKKGGKVAISKEGSFVIMSCAENLKIVHEGKDSDEQIRVVRFSPDCKLFAVGSEDSRVCIYNVKDQFSRKCTISAHKAPIFSIDFNNESSYVMTVDTTKRLCYCDASSGVAIPTPAVLRDEKWSTWSSPVGWPTLGLWYCQPDNSFPYVAQKSWSGLLMGVGNTSGRIFVVHNPCQDRSGFISNAGHAGTVSALSWLAGDGTIVTTGLKDHCMMQWRCIYDQVRESGDEGGISCDDSQMELDGGYEFKPKDIQRKNKDLDLNRAEIWRSGIAPPSVVAPTEQDQALALLPSSALMSKSQSTAAKKYEQEGSVDTKPPYKVLLKHVFGLKITDSRQTIRYNENGHHVYIAGTYGIILNRDDECKQQIYQQHKHVLLCLDVSSNSQLVATGELANNPELHIWDATTAANIAVITDIHRRGIASIRFTPCNHYLVTLGQDKRNSVVVLCSPSGLWNDCYVQASCGISTQKMLWCTSLENSSNEYPYVVGGNRAIYFFRCAGKSIERCRGVVGKKRKLQPIMCAAKGHPIATLVNLETSTDGNSPVKTKKGDKKSGSGKNKLDISSDIIGGNNQSYAIDTAATTNTNAINNSGTDTAEENVGLIGGGGAVAEGPYKPPCLLLTGTVTGHIYVWVNNRVHLSVVAHDGSVNAIVTTKTGYITASKEGLVKVWNMKLKLAHTYNTQMSFVPRPLDFSIHALAVNPASTKLTIGMKTGEMYEVNLTTHSKVMLLESHSQRELQAIAMNPANPAEFATGGDDGIIRIWDIPTASCIRKVSIDVACRAVAYSPDGSCLALGIGGNPKTATKDGAFMILDSVSLEVIYEERKSKKYVTDIKYGSDGLYLAIGAMDGKLLIVDTKNSYAIVHNIDIPPKDTGILRLDFSVDCKTIRLHTTSNELFYYSMETGNIVLTPSSIRDVKWDSFSCIYSWNTQGVFRENTENIDVISTAVVTPQRAVSTNLVTAKAGQTQSKVNTSVLAEFRANANLAAPNTTANNVSLTAVSYQNGDVRIYNYPCTTQHGEYIDVPGIGTQAKRLAFSKEGDQLFVLDSYSRTIQQYDIIFDKK